MSGPTDFVTALKAERDGLHAACASLADQNVELAAQLATVHDNAIEASIEACIQELGRMARSCDWGEASAILDCIKDLRALKKNK